MANPGNFLMSSTEIEFELSALQYELMDFPGLRQGQSLNLILDSAVLLPDLGAENWFTVQQEPLPYRFVHVGWATYAFAGLIAEADIVRDDGIESATLLVDCGSVLLRVTCGPQDDDTLPYGTWETRYISGVTHLYATVEDEYASDVGQNVGVTLWGFRRLMLNPGDPMFGQWYESVELLPHPFTYDRVVVIARAHDRSSGW